MSKLYILAAASVVCAFDIPLEILLLFISALPHEFTDYGGKLRSHLGLIVHVPAQNEGISSFVSKMSSADIAGYEDARRKNDESRVLFRESKLTRMWQDSSRGTSKVLSVSCLNPSFFKTFSQRLLQSDDKAFELNKLQISLYEEFFGKSIAAIPPVPVEVCKVNTDVSNAFFFTDIQNQNNSTDNGFTIHGTDTQKMLIDNVTRRSKDSPSNLLDNVTRDVTRGRDKKCFSAVK
ncbi:hypothetical protein KIW84_062356 [Lathyrus oleraceus]|uniref:Uncharacterized protein n=1 Tax=Pisum sativum TaxID=3888 RepID=A0A9D4W6V8_PEA|nr:hypothetical protein KIW84_062356 [Pisum sativum]